VRAFREQFGRSCLGLRFGSWCLMSSLCLEASAAHAYCIATTVAPKFEHCPATCVNEGVPQHWATLHLTYIFNQRSFPDLTNDELRSVFVRAFEPWQQVDCDGAPLGFRIEQRVGTSRLEVGPRQDEPNDNVIMYFPPEEWSEQGLSPSAFALTTIFYKHHSGVIIGADMYFNGGQGPFILCADDGCSDPEKSDLLNLATHEAGHFLGLAHSDDPESTMYCSADQGEIKKRSLSADDRAGLCALYGSENLPGMPAYGYTCALAERPHSHTWPWLTPLIPAMFAWRRKSRRFAA
jgi:hypothetical protein